MEWSYSVRCQPHPLLTTSASTVLEGHVTLLNSGLGVIAVIMSERAAPQCMRAKLQYGYPFPVGSRRAHGIAINRERMYIYPFYCCEMNLSLRVPPRSISKQFARKTWAQLRTVLVYEQGYIQFTPFWSDVVESRKAESGG